MSLIEPIVCLVLILFLEIIETAVFTVHKGVLLEKSREIKGSSVYSRALFLKNNIKEVMIVILFLDTIMNNLLGLYIARIIAKFEMSYFMMTFTNMIFSFLQIYLIILVKIFAIMHVNSAIGYFSSPFYWLFKIFRPVGLFFSSVSMYFLRKKNQETKDDKIAGYRSEILASLEECEENDEIKEDVEMMKGLLLLREVNIGQIMTPRSDFIDAEFSNDIHVMRQRLFKFNNVKHIVIWDDTEDNIIGTINLQKFFIDCAIKKASNVMDYIVPPQFFVHTTDARRVLGYMKKTKAKIVFVIEEDGSICGLATLMDIINDIVGEIEEDDEISKSKDGYIIKGSHNIRSLNRKFDLDLPEECSTVGGLLIVIDKKIPKPNEEFSIDNVTFKILSSSKNKIDTILMRINKKNPDNATEHSE
jgi:CBS domain containing-hemolysin-like protein